MGKIYTSISEREKHAQLPSIQLGKPSHDHYKWVKCQSRLMS